jgi:hypothetical protein
MYKRDMNTQDDYILDVTWLSKSLQRTRNFILELCTKT